MGGGTRQRSQGFDDWLRRRYERRRARHIADAKLLDFFMAAVIAVSGLTVGCHFMAVSVAETVLVAAVVFWLVALVVWLGIRALQDDFDAVAHAADHPGAPAPGVAAIGRNLSANLGWQGGIRGALIAAPIGAALPNLLSDEATLGSWVLVFFGSQIIVVAAVLFAYFGCEVWLRPVHADLSLRDLEDAPEHRIGVAAKLVLGMIVVVALVALFVGGSMTSAGGGAGAFVDLYAATMAGSVLGITGGLMLSRILLSPVGDLTTATEQVMQGDLDARVPITATDELGALADRFNRMVDGLREREELREDLRESRSRLVAAADAERRRVERDIHDGAQQQLVLARLQLSSLGRELGDTPAFVQVRESIDRALTDLRDLAHGIYPAALESSGIAGALAVAADRSVLPVRLEGSGDCRYAREVEAAVYFCCMEAMQNASKHAGTGTSVTIDLDLTADRLAFAVADDGPGFDIGAKNGSHGLQNMADRIGALGGSLRIDSAPGSGTTVSGRIDSPA